MTEQPREWLAWINIGTGCCWTRQRRKEWAIDTATKLLKDWDRLYDIYDKEVTVHVVEVTGYGDLVWDYEGVHGVPEGGEEGKYTAVPYKVEHVKAQSPSKPKQRKRA